MDVYVEKMIQTLSQKLKSKDTTITPYGNNIYENGNGKPFGKLRAEYLW